MLLHASPPVALVATKTALLKSGGRNGVDSAMLHREFMGQEWRELVGQRFILGVEKGGGNGSRLQPSTEVRRWILQHHPTTGGAGGAGAGGNAVGIRVPFRILKRGVAFNST